MALSIKTPNNAEEAAAASTLVELLRLRAATHSDRILYTFLSDGEHEETHLSYTELDRRARVIAALLQRSESRCERALLLYPAGLDFVAAFFGCLYAGVVPVPTYPPHQAQPNRLPYRLRALLDDAQPSFALTNGVMLSNPDGVCARVTELRAVRWVATDDLDEESADDWRDPEARGDDLALLQYTSGSTSSPKGVMVTHRNLMHNQRIIQEAFGQNADSVVVGWLPLYHDMGLIGNVLQPLYAGARCILMSPVAFMQSPARWLQAISRYRATTSGGPNFAYDLCVRKITPEQRALLDLSSWSVAFNGAEPIRYDTLERFAATFAPCGFRRAAWFPCYGLAEATLFVSGGVGVDQSLTRTIRASALEQGHAQEAMPAERDSRTLVTCGQPPAEQRVIIVDPASSKRSAPGRVGEIWMAGKSVAKGYWNRPAETEETFGAFLSDTMEGPFLRTGDLGFIDEGALYVTGRLKDLIIIRGRNHYPQDIERTVEQSHRAFRPGGAAAFAFERDGSERLVVLQELDPRQRNPDFETLAAAVRHAIAEHHELSVYDVLLLKAGSLPKTSSGKIQRHACRDGYLAGSLNPLGRDTLEDEGTEPWANAEFDEATFDREHLLATPTHGRQSLLETFLLTQVAHTLGISHVRLSREKALSAQGLDSLSTLELKGRIEASLGVTIPLTNFLDGSTAADLAHHILDALAGSSHLSDSSAPPELPARASSYPLSRGQKALWLLHRFAPTSAAYVISNAVHIRTTLDEYALRHAFQELVNRHPALRTTFSAPEGVPVQHVHELADVCFETEDASGWDDAALQARLAEDSCRPFDLERGPLIRAHLYKRSGDDHTLLLAVHHIIADLLSVWVLVYELEVLYAQASRGASANLKQPRAQFADYVAWQEALLAGREGEQLWNYWRDQLAGDLPVLNLPTDRPRPPVQSYRGASQSIALGPELMGKVKNLCSAEGVTLYTLLVAIFQVLLFRYTGQQDILIGSPASGRTRAEFDDVIGYFVNPLVLRMRPEGQTPFKTFLADVRRTVLSALDHQDFPFPLLVERLQPARDPSRSPIFQVMFVLEKVTKPELQPLNALALREAGVRVEVGELTFDTVGLEQQAAPFDLTFVVAETEGGLNVRAEYARELFAAETVRRLLGHYAQLLEGATQAPRTRLSELPLLSEAERRQLEEWNQTESEYRLEQCVHELFAQQVAATPSRQAVIFRDEGVSYQALNERANRLAHYLRRLGVRAETRVGVLLERSAELVVALLGTLKSGGVYVPLEASQPRERLQFMAADAELQVLVTQQRLAAVIPAGDFKVIYLDRDGDRDELEQESPVQPSHGVEAENAAYLIYTSGSTGNPKAVVVAHRSLTDVVLTAKQKFNFTAGDVFPCLASFAFDISLFELLPPLLSGGTARVLAADEILDLDRLVSVLAEVTVLHAVPSLMGQVVGRLEERVAAGERRPRLRAVFVGGEAVPAALLERVRAGFPEAVVQVLYGPTEAAIICASYLPGPRGAPQPEQAIGRPLPNAQLWVQGVGGQLAPVGVAGELLIGGVGVARGYLNRPELTAERFLPDSFSGKPGARLYRTGDLARYLPDGELEFLGRVDAQVKVRGYRIELGEIEAALLRHEEVRECVVTAREDEGGGKRLVAYVVSAREPGVSSTELREHLRRSLPEYMVPAQFERLERLPLTANGKVDRKALPAPAQTRELGAGYQAPRTAVEEMVAGIWGELLGLGAVGREENFFDLGGHSLLVTQVAARVQNVFDVEIPVSVYFQEPTIESLALAITQSQASRNDADAGSDGAATRGNNITRRDAGASQVPLSFAQQRLWFVDQLEPGNPRYNIPAAIRLQGELRIDVLEKALNEIVRRHESLRTVFADEGGQPMQQFVPSLTLPLPAFDFQHLSPTERNAETEKIYEHESQHRFSLASGPLLRAAVVRHGAEEHVLILTLHHIVADGWSVHLFFRELTILYDAFAQGRPSPLAELPIQYADFAVWQRKRLTAEVIEGQLAYWREQLGAIAAPLRLPFELERAAAQDNRGASQAFALSPALSDELKALSRREGVTLFMLLLAAFQTLLHRYTGREDILVGTDIAARQQAETESLIGFFANQLVMRVDAGRNPTFQEFLQRVKLACLGAYAHQDVPFDRLVDDLHVQRDVSRHPLFEIKFVFWQSPMLPPQSSALTLSPLDFERRTAKFDLTLFVVDSGPQLTGTLEYDSGLFDAATAARIIEHFQTLLTSITAEPATRILSLEMLTGSEKEQRSVKQTKRREARRELFKKVRPKQVSLSERGLVRSGLKFGASLPLVFEPTAADVDLADWVRCNLPLIESGLLQHGALLFRGFPVYSVSPFEQLATAVCKGLFNENGEHPRKSVSGNVYTPVFYPADRQLLWHNENSFNHRWPLRILFCNLKPAEQGGETPIVDSRQVYARIPPEIREEFAAKKIMYVRNYGDGMGLNWQAVFNTTDKAEVEARCRSAFMSCEWKGRDRLRTTCIRPAVINHPRTAEMSWFNQAQHWHTSCLDPVTRESIEKQFEEADYPRQCYYGDGTSIADDVLSTILKVYGDLEVVFPPQRGDILLLDNVLTAHARKPFAGPREVLVAMGEMSSFDDVQP